MKAPLRRISEGAIVLASIFGVAVIGYRWLGDYDWVEAVWMVVITISTVGYSESSGLTPQLQVFTIGVILFGMTAAFYTFGGLFQLVLEGELERLLGRRRMEKEISKLSGHILICGYGRMGQNLATELTRVKQPIAVVDNDLKAVEEAQSNGVRCIHGDATQEEVLRSLRIEQAATLVSALPSDAESVFITLTARNLNPTLQIIARAEHKSTEGKLLQAGANRVVMPTIIGAHQMVRMITRPSTADLMDLVNRSSFAELELEEFLVIPSSPLVGMSIRDADAFRRHKLLVIAIKDADSAMTFNPTAERQFARGDTVMLLGHAEDIERFCREYTG